MNIDLLDPARPMGLPRKVLFFAALPGRCSWAAYGQWRGLVVWIGPEGSTEAETIKMVKSSTSFSGHGVPDTNALNSFLYFIWK